VTLSCLFAGAPFDAGSSTPVVLFLHGFPEGSWSWSQVLAAGAGLDDIAIGEHAHGGAACADGAACVARTGPFTLPSPAGQAAEELPRWPG
jgi:pimeloyl-ACP methyl ester carboxylesterase